MSDHYNPRSKKLRLSQQVYYTPSVAAAGIAAHEAGHALQDAEDYFAMEARTYIISSCLLHRIHDELHEIINVSRSFGRRSEPEDEVSINIPESVARNVLSESKR